MSTASDATYRTVLVPTAFDVHDCLPAGLWRHADAVKVILSFIIEHDRGRDGWVWISVRTGRRLVGRKIWHPVKLALIRAGAIEYDPRCRRGDDPHAVRYRLADRWRSRSIEPCRIRDKHLERQLRRQQAALAPVDHHMTKMLERVTIDRDAANRWAKRHIRKPNPDNNKPGKRKVDRQHLALCSIERIAAGNMTLSRGRRNNRVHSPLTGLYGDIRDAFVMIDGQPIVGMDVRQCQPYQLGLLTANLCMHPNTVTLQPEQQQRRQQQQPGTTPDAKPVLARHFLHLCKHPIVESPSLPSDVVKHLAACEDGTYYLDFAKAVSKPGGRPLTLRAAKRGWLRFAFGRHRPRGRWYRRFQLHYPTVAAVLADLKTTNYKHAALTLQRLEAAVMIDGVAERLRVRFPHIPFFLVHDGIFCTSENLAVVKAVNSEVWSQFGARPMVG
jgi:hypothetical protein